MKPSSFSASAFQVAETCLARYHAENILKTSRPPNLAADLGTAVHAALEQYVNTVYILKKAGPSLPALLTLYRTNFAMVFGTVDPESHEWYSDGLNMVQAWFVRTDFSNREVISVETKTNFMIKTSIGEIPFNYIWDRFDRITDQDETYEVVDYKTIRKAINPEGLRKKIQARFYGLAAQIQVPTAKRIWVRFDLLRHDSVATVFTRDDNIATWKFAKALAEKIIETPEPGTLLPDGSKFELPETLNPECNFCVRKTNCEALKSNVGGAGVWSLRTTADRIDARAQLEFQRKGLDAAIAEIDEILLREMVEGETTELTSDRYKALARQSYRRQVDAERVEHVVGEDLFRKYGGVRLTMTDFNKLKKDKQLTNSQRAQLEQLVYKAAGELKLAIEPKNPIDDEDTIPF